MKTGGKSPVFFACGRRKRGRPYPFPHGRPGGDNLVAMRADGEISKEQFQSLRHKAEIEIAALNEELAKLNAVSDEAAQALDMDAIEAALNEVLDF